MTTETEREALRRAWGQRPLALHVGRCPKCGRTFGVKAGVLNGHRANFDDARMRCPGGTPEEVTAL